MKQDGARRVVEECPWRANVRNAGTQEEVATCRLLGEITGIEDESLFEAARMNCDSCVHKFEPSRDRINALIATLLFHLSNRIMERGGTEGYGPEKAKELQSFAKSHLPVISYNGWSQRTAPRNLKQPCFYLGDETGQRDCRTCRGSVRQKVFGCHHERHQETTIQDCQSCQDYEPPLEPGTIRSWAVGVTTAPRREATLAQSLASLAAAGWPAPHVFAEPESPLPEDLGAELRTIRTVRLGAWPNWLLTLAELMMRAPQADAYLLCQDDVLYCRGLRAFLEETLWPAPRVGVVSLHTASHQDRGDDHGFYATQHGWSSWGAQAYVFPNAAARALFRHPRVLNHRKDGPRGGSCNVDSVVGQWALDSGLPYFLHSPSLTQHVGESSTLWEAATTTGRRRAASFIGQGPDIRDYLSGAAKALPGDRSVSAPIAGHQAVVAESEPASPPEEANPSLAIVTVHIGRLHCFERWKDWVLHADLPRQTALYLVDNSGDSSFGTTLATAISEFVKSRRFQGLSVRSGPGPVQGGPRLSFARLQNFADAINLILPSLREDFVLIVDDDTIPPYHAPATLLGELQKRMAAGEKVGLVSGIYESANAPGKLVVARSKEGWRDVPAVGDLGPQDVIEVGFVGNGCCLLDGKALAEVGPLRAHQRAGNLGSGADTVLCQELRKRGYLLLAHGGVFCSHLF